MSAALVACAIAVEVRRNTPKSEIARTLSPELSACDIERNTAEMLTVQESEQRTNSATTSLFAGLQGAIGCIRLIGGADKIGGGSRAALVLRCC